MQFRRTVLAAAAALLALIATAPAQAQAWPERPVRLIIPYPAGGGADAAARLVAAQLGKEFGQNFIVDSRPGGNTMIGATAAARAPADGYTLLMLGGSTMTALPLMADKLPIDPVADLVPIGMVSRFPFVIVAATQFGTPTLGEALSRARAKPGDVAYASNGMGSMAQLGMEWIAHDAKVKLLHVPFKGFGPAVTELVAGRIPLMMADWAPIAGQVQAGALKMLAVTSSKRFPLLPDVPTVAEQGFNGYDLDIWFGLYAPNGTPPEIVNRVGDALRRWLATPEAREAYARLGHEPAPSTAAEVRARIAAERKAYAPVVKAANIRAE